MRLIHYTIGLLGLTTLFVGNSTSQAKLFPYPKLIPGTQDSATLQSTTGELKIDGISLSCHWRVAQGVKKPGEKFFQLLAIASKYNEAGQQEQAGEVLSQALPLAKTLDYLPARSALEAMVYGQYALAGQRDRALQGLGELRQVTDTLADAYQARAFLEIAKEYTQAGQSDRTLQFLNRGSEIAKIATDEPFEQVRVLAELGDEYLKVGQKDKATLVLIQGIQITKNRKNFPFEPWKFPQLLSKLAATSIAIGRDDLTTQIRQVARSMPARYSTQVLTAIASAYTKAKQPEKATQLLSQSLELAKTIKLDGSSISGVSLKISVLLEIAAEYLKLGQPSLAQNVLSLALQVAQNLPQDNPSVDFGESQTIAIAKIASKYGLIGQIDQAKALLAQTLKIANQFNQGSTSQKSNHASYILRQIASAYASLGDYAQALRVANTIQDIDTKAETFVEIAGNYPDSQKAETARMLAQALQIAQTSKDPIGQGNALLEIALKYLEIGQKDHAGQLLTTAFQLIKSQELSWFKFARMTKIAEKFGETGQKEKAAAVAATALPETKELMNSCAKNEALMMVSQMYVSAGEYDQALQIAKTINTCEYRSKALAKIAIAYAKQGQYPQALQVTEAIQSDAKVHLLSVIAVNYATAGNYDQALQIARSLQDHSRKIQVLVEIAGSYATLGKNSPATTILQEAQETLNNFEDNYFKAYALTEIAGNYAKVGQQSTALKLLGDAKELSQTLVNPTEKDSGFDRISISRRDDIWSAIAIQSLKMGQLETALTSINTLKDASAKVKVLGEIASFYTKSGAKAKAATVLAQALLIAQTLEFNKSDALEAIAAKYATLEQYDQAKKVVNSIADPQQRDRWTHLLECTQKNYSTISEFRSQNC